MNDFDRLQAETYDRVSHEAVTRRTQAAVRVAELLPQMRTTGDLEELEAQGFSLRSDFGSLNLKSLESPRVRLGYVNRTLTKKGSELLAVNFGDFPLGKIESACVASSGLALRLILDPPKGVEVCSRNPKLEYPRLANLLLHSKLHGQPVPFVVPCCPDTDQYRLGNGLGEVIPKGLDYCQTVRDLTAAHGFDAFFDLQVADVEGLDPVILTNSGETAESHFIKTGATIAKSQSEVVFRGLVGAVGVRSMLSAFAERGMDYIATQASAAKRIADSSDRKIHNTVEGLLKERVRLGNFSRFDDEARRDLVIAELAGYAAYGAMVGGRAVILSPDAKSAIPAYHYAVDTPEQYSPVMYAA